LLLIAFSVGLGTIVMNWGQGYIAEKAEFVQSAHAAEVGCDGVTADVVSIAGEPVICTEDGMLKVFLENLANEPLQGMQARVTGTTDFRVVDNILSPPLGAAQSRHVTIDVSGLGDLMQLKLTPAIVQGDLRQFCLHNAVVLEKPFGPC